MAKAKPQQQQQQQQSSEKKQQHATTAPPPQTASSASSNNNNNNKKNSSKNKGAATTTLDPEGTASIWERPFDWFIIGFYLVFILSSATIDYHNVLAPYLGLSIEQLAEQHEKKPLGWPLKIITDQVFMPWGRNIDPIMIENPFFWQVMEWINILFLSPMNAVLAFAFLTGRAGSYRNWALIHASGLLYSMVLCLATGVPEAVNVIQFVICYSLYATYPISIIVRLWNEKPFTRRVVNGKSWLQKLLQVALVVHLIFFILFCYHWLVIHTPFAQGLPDWYPYFDEHVLSKVPLLAEEPYATWLKQLNAQW